MANFLLQALAIVLLEQEQPESLINISHHVADSYLDMGTARHSGSIGSFISSSTGFKCCRHQRAIFTCVVELKHFCLRSQKNRIDVPNYLLLAQFAQSIKVSKTGMREGIRLDGMLPLNNIFQN